MKRGVFSNEAGLGSSVMVHSSSNVKEPVRQGMWGIFEVFADTMVVCTLTAFAVLSSGLIDLDTGAVLVDSSGSALVGQAFATVFGSFGPAFIAIAILLFAFSTVLGWSHYGSKAGEYLFGTKSTIIYKVAFVLMIFIGCTMNLGLGLGSVGYLQRTDGDSQPDWCHCIVARSNEDHKKLRGTYH